MDRRDLAREAERRLCEQRGLGAQALLAALDFPAAPAVALVTLATQTPPTFTRRWVTILPDCDHGAHANVWDCPPALANVLRAAGFVTDGEGYVYCASELAHVLH